MIVMCNNQSVLFCLLHSYQDKFEVPLCMLGVTFMHCSFNLVGHIHEENKTVAGLDQSVEPFTAMGDVLGPFFGAGPKAWSQNNWETKVQYCLCPAND